MQDVMGKRPHHAIAPPIETHWQLRFDPLERIHRETPEYFPLVERSGIPVTVKITSVGRSEFAFDDEE